VTSNEKQPTLKYKLPLETATVKDVQDMTSIKNAFQVIEQDTSLTLVGGNTGEKTLW
jgi:hypothetical protein